MQKEHAEMEIKMNTFLFENCDYQLKAKEIIKEIQFLQKYQKLGIMEEKINEKTFNENGSV